MKINRVLPFLLFFLFCTMAVALTKEEEEEKEAPGEKVERIRESAKDKFIGKDTEDTIERIRKHEEARMEKLAGLLVEKKLHLEDHYAGRRKLSEKDVEFYSRQVDAFQKKLDHHNSMTHDEYEEYLREKASTIHQVRRLKIPEL